MNLPKVRYKSRNVFDNVFSGQTFIIKVLFKLWKQNIAFALSAFTDGAHVFRGYDMTLNAVPGATGEQIDLYDNFVFNRKDGLHASAGAGLRFIMNQNFIVAFEGAQCFNKQDGGFAFYLNTGFLF